MRIILRKRTALLFVSLLFVIALIPAFHWAADDGRLGEDCPVCRAYGQLFSIDSAFVNIDLSLFWVRISSSIDIACILTNALPSSSESRAPPA